jgi:hypothetical protein
MTDATARSDRGLEFWLDHGPDVLERYRRFAEVRARAGDPRRDETVRSFAFYTFYALTGHAEGIRALVHAHQAQGLDRDQVLEGLGIAFIHGGPRGMETIAEALADYAWLKPDRPATFPVGWGVDPDAFRSGLDWSDPTLSREELRGLEGWYERWHGEVPRYVRFLGRHRPHMLKAHRYRYEHLIKVLPKQILPMTLLAHNVLRGFGEGIRENVQLARGFGVSKDDVLDEIAAVLVNAGPEAVDVVDAFAGDVLDDWAGTAPA